MVVESEIVKLARFDNGWVKLWRSAGEGDLPQNIFLWGLWSWLLCAAHWRPATIVWKGKRRDIPAGVVVLGIKELAIKWDCSQRTISKWLHYLHDSERIVLESCSRGTLVTICNWETYQSKEDAACAPSAREVLTACEPTARQVGLIEEVKNIRREEIEKCFEAWGKTLSRLEIKKSPRLDEVPIAQLLSRYGFDKTFLALLGAGFEEAGKDYDPKKHVSIRRLLKPDIFETFVNLGAQNKPVTHETVEWNLTLGAKS